MIHLGVQYYRPPFPNKKHWREDLHRIAESGLNTIQLWAVWAWIEPKPGEWIFDDYDELIELAGEAGSVQVELDVGAEIPETLYEAVAEILREAWEEGE